MYLANIFFSLSEASTAIALLSCSQCSNSSIKTHHDNAVSNLLLERFDDRILLVLKHYCQYVPNAHRLCTRYATTRYL